MTDNNTHTDVRPPVLRVKRLHPDARLPTRSGPLEAGLDLYALEDTPLRGGAVMKVRTGVAVEIPEGYAGLVWERGGLSSRGVAVRGGVIDSTYRGEIVVMLLNHGGHGYHTVLAGDRIAQMLIQPVLLPAVEEAGELSDTDRGDKGFGSSGR